jgi:hypothetical protein
MNLKPISSDAVPRALELAERYRLLNEPEQAESICRDALAANPGDQMATRTLLLALSDQFHHNPNSTVQHAQELAQSLTDKYERHYYTGVVLERWARTKLQQKQPTSMVVDWLHRAMEQFDLAEAERPAHNDAAILRWNTCARLLQKLPQTEQIAVGADIFD